MMKVISEFAELGGKAITITGGEPFVRGAPFLMDIIEAAKDRSLLTNVYTSGYIMNEELAKKLHKSGVDLVCVSLEGLEETHDMITGVAGSFRKAFMTLKLLQRYGVSTRIHFTPMRINYAEFKGVMDSGKSVGAATIKIFKFSPQGRARENRQRLELSSGETDAFVSSVRSALSQDGITIHFGGLISGLSNSCSVGKKIAITCEGLALPCLGLQEKSVILGDVTREPLHEIWRRIQSLTCENVCLCDALKIHLKRPL